jgi:hypothetical protein
MFPVTLILLRILHDYFSLTFALQLVSRASVSKCADDLPWMVTPKHGHRIHSGGRRKTNTASSVNPSEQSEILASHDSNCEE